MERSQYNLCMAVLKRLHQAGILEHIVLVGSWCGLFYQTYFGDKSFLPLLKTRDMDLLIPRPSSITRKVDVAQLLEELGFVVGFTGEQGYIRLEHPALIVEFLTPERGRSIDKPVNLPQLGLNAQSLRFMDYLADNTITVVVQDIAVTVPHPANFALHKLIISDRRTDRDKKDKDIQAAGRVLEALIQAGQNHSIHRAFDAMPKRWRQMVDKALQKLEIEGLDLIR